MTGYDYSKLAATALRIIGRFGTAATISRTAPGSGPAHNPGVGATTTFACIALVEEYSNFERDGTRIQIGDRKVSIAAKGLALEPAPGDKVTIGAQVYTVVVPRAIAPGDTVLVWTLQVRR